MKKRILIKIGGRAFEGEPGFKELAGAITANPAFEVIIVHGGGAEISAALKAANRPTEFIDGIRVTQADDIRIVEGVLSETINSRIAGWLKQYGVRSRRMSGKTEGMLIVEPLTRGNRDYGFVGQINQVNPSVIEKSLEESCVPVISPISADKNGSSYNVNADSAAAVLAASIGCTDLVFITDVAGVSIDDQPQDRMTIDQATTSIESGDIQGGMVAKLESAIQALEKGVDRIYIGQWRNANTLQEIGSGQSTSGTWLER